MPLYPRFWRDNGKCKQKNKNKTLTNIEKARTKGDSSEITIDRTQYSGMQSNQILSESCWTPSLASTCAAPFSLH
jgi:hypothetical protein